MFDTFRQDLRRWIIPGQIVGEAALTPGAILRLFWQHMPVRATAFFRLACWLKQHRIPLFPGFLQRLIYCRYGLEIPSGATIGGGLYIAHPVGTSIMPRSIGRNCSIIAAVTIGMRNKHAFPEIGNNVTISAGARVLGGIRVGDDAVIGANAVVIREVPNGGTAVGVPARVIKVYGQPVT